MKSIISLSALLTVGMLSYGQTKTEGECSSDCGDKCATECSEKCDSACSSKGDMAKVSFVVSDADEAGLTAAQEKITALAGTKSCKSCDQSGTVTIKYDPATVKSDELHTALKASGLNVVGQKASMNVSNMSCGSCVKNLSEVLTKTDGVTSVDKVCHKSGTACVTFDPAKTDLEKVKDAINATKYKVVEKKAAETPAES